MNSAIEALARLGIMGFLGVATVLTLLGLTAYGFVERPDHDLTAQLIGILGVGAGALLTGIGKFFGGDRVNLEPFLIPPPEEIDGLTLEPDSEGEG